jgi:hypothetical protein
LKGEIKMKVYDKAAWHIDAGEDSNAVIEKFKIIFSFLKMKNMLNADGLEILDLGIDSSISLHERLLTYEGNIFIKEYYDDIINLKNDEILTKLKFLQ